MVLELEEADGAALVDEDDVDDSVTELELETE